MNKKTYSLTKGELNALLKLMKTGSLDNYLASVFIEKLHTPDPAIFYPDREKEHLLVCILKPGVNSDLFSFYLGIELGKLTAPIPCLNETIKDLAAIKKDMLKTVINYKFTNNDNR